MEVADEASATLILSCHARHFADYFHGNLVLKICVPFQTYTNLEHKIMNIGFIRVEKYPYRSQIPKPQFLRKLLKMCPF